VTPHVYTCHVRFSDVDVYGHVNNVKYVEYYQESRIAFLTSLAGDLLASGSNERQVVARVDVDYKRPILFRPEPYLVETWVTHIGTSSYELGSRIRSGADEDAALCSTSRVRLVAYDLEARRSRPLAAHERELLGTALLPDGP
jgi:acyl-CoA thioester hydrolase